jgi:predicted ATPase/class 3 adenylate cyclase
MFPPPILTRVATLPSGLVTFLFSDIEGSTRLLRERERGYAALLRSHRETVREEIVAHDGIEIDTQGDAFFVVFPDADSALNAAEAIQMRHAPGPVRVRIGLHSAVAEPTEEGAYVGLGVHEGARVCAAAHGGQVLVSEATRQRLTRPLRELGEFNLKDFPDPVRLFQLGDDDFGPPRTQRLIRVPTPPTPFIGREEDVNEVVDLVRLGQHRVVTLTGPGGSGKTRLAIEAAGRLSVAFPDGVFFVDLSPVATPEAAWGVIGRALGAAANLEARIGGGRVLLVLDNLEQIAGFGAAVAGLLAACSNCRILGTSRMPLRLTTEHTRAVDPLARSEAVELFTSRALAVFADFAPDASVAEICRQVDDLPLAIELAAARTGLLSTAEILARLDRRLRLLTRGPSDAGERQQTLEATIAWSYNLLGPDEQRLFARLGVFAGGWTIDAAEAVCDATVDGLSGLAEASLVRRVDGRFAMLETIREFAVDRLAESADHEQMLERHAQYVHDLAVRIGRSKAEGSGPFDLLLEDDANVQVALAYLVDQPSTDRALELVLELWMSWIGRGRLAEGDEWMTRALARADRSNLRLWEEGLSIAGEFARFRGDHERALRLKWESLHIAKDLGMHNKVAAALNDIGMIELGRGNLEEARRLTEEAVTLRKALGKPHGIAHALAGLAEVELGEGLPEVAVQLLEEALAIARAEGMIGSQRTDLGVVVLVRLGEAHRRLGHLDLAGDLISEGLRNALTIELVDAMRFGLEATAAILAVHGNAERAARLLGAAARSLRETGFVDEVPTERTLTEEALRRALGSEGYRAAFEAGSELTLTEAVNLALG